MANTSTAVFCLRRAAADRWKKKDGLPTGFGSLHKSGDSSSCVCMLLLPSPHHHRTTYRRGGDPSSQPYTTPPHARPRWWSLTVCDPQCKQGGRACGQPPLDASSFPLSFLKDSAWSHRPTFSAEVVQPSPTNSKECFNACE